MSIGGGSIGFNAVGSEGVAASGPPATTYEKYSDINIAISIDSTKLLVSPFNRVGAVSMVSSIVTDYVFDLNRAVIRTDKLSTIEMSYSIPTIVMTEV